VVKYSIVTSTIAANWPAILACRRAPTTVARCALIRASARRAIPARAGLLSRSPGVDPPPTEQRFEQVVRPARRRRQGTHPTHRYCCTGAQTDGCALALSRNRIDPGGRCHERRIIKGSPKTRAPRSACVPGRCVTVHPLGSLPLFQIGPTVRPPRPLNAGL